jgi:hypothetical protein
MTAAERIWRALDDLQKVQAEYRPDGDWHGCVGHAIGFLREALRSSPPGFGRVPDEQFRVGHKPTDQ